MIGTIDVLDESNVIDAIDSDQQDGTVGVLTLFCVVYKFYMQTIVPIFDRNTGICFVGMHDKAFAL